MQRRAFSLIEILIVVAILAVLAALLFPVFARAKERAKITGCGARLHQFATALVLYRGDHDDRGYVWTSHDGGEGKGHGFLAPYVMFQGMRGYLGDGSPLWCPEPLRVLDGGAWNLYAYRALGVRREDAPGTRLHVPIRPVPSTVVAYCENHTSAEREPRYGGAVRVGVYPFVREDTSFGVVPSAALRVEYFDDRKWYDEFKSNRSEIFRFPGEPWPPTLDP